MVVSDLTYVNVSGKWHYICLLMNLFNREIVGYSAGPNKDAKLVYEAFMNSKINLKKVKIFHTDRGNEFKNKIIVKNSNKIRKYYRINFSKNYLY